LSRLCFAILAHNQPACLEDLIYNLRAFAPGSDVVLFNGGRDPHLGNGLGVDVCPFSRPLRYEKLADFQLDTMRWLTAEQRPYEFLVTVDSDMLLIKRGLPDYLEATMGESAYMAVGFGEIPPSTTWLTGRRFHYKWASVWQPLLGTRYPYGCFNPGQVFRRHYVESLMRFPNLDELRRRIDQSHIPALEEMLYSTLAVALNCAPRPWPNPAAIRFLGPHSPVDIARYRARPDTFLIHPVTMRVDAPEREFVRALAEEKPADVALFQAAFEQYPRAEALRKRLVKSLVGPALSGVRDLYLQLLPQ
jgi:hypothetical protein